MKFLKYLAVFGLFALAFSACGGANGGPAAPNQAAAAADSTYPMVSDGILNAEVTDADGNKFKVTDLKGNVVIINIWATWCGPCIAEMPELVKMQEELGPKGFKILGLDSDPDTPEMLKEFSAKHKLNYPLIMAQPELESQIMRLAKSEAIPTSILIDRSGHLRGVFKGGGSTVLKLREFAEKAVAEN